MENRHRARILALKALYSWEINKSTTSQEIHEMENMKLDRETRQYGDLLFTGVTQNIKQIDDIIDSHVINWEFNRLGLVDLAILRLSIYTLIFLKDIPKNIVINEGINIAKEYCSDKAFKFINGILDSVNVEVELSKLIRT